MATASPTPSRDTDLQYSTIDRPDDTDLYQVHFIYAIPSDGIDRFRDINGQIALSANAANHYLGQLTGGPKLRYDTHKAELDISFMKIPYTAEQLSELGTALASGLDQLIRDYGFSTQNKIYFVYYDGLHVLRGGENAACGVGIRPPDDWGVTGVLFLQGYSATYQGVNCPQPSKTENYAGWLEIVMLHEVFHVLGAVPLCAPNFNGAHVSDAELDLMSAYFDPSIGPVFILDRNNDDYFNHQNLGCPDVADSVFLDPLPPNAQEPPSWNFSSGRRTFNPFDFFEISEPVQE